MIALVVVGGGSRFMWLLNTVLKDWSRTIFVEIDSYAIACHLMRRRTSDGDG